MIDLLIKNIKRRVRIWRDTRVINKSDLFDPHYYLVNNPDLADTRLSPLQHFVQIGGWENRNPSPSFDTQFYLQQYPDVKAFGMHPLVHYIRYGRKEGRFSQLADWEKMIESTIDEDERILLESGFFNVDHYFQVNQDAQQLGMHPARHYLLRGWKADQDVVSGFDTQYYLETNPDVKALGTCPLLHYLKYGIFENRLPTPFTIDEEACIQEADISSFHSDRVTINPCKIAIVWHVYFVDLLDEMINYLKKMPVEFNLYVTTIEAHVEVIRSIVTIELPHIPMHVIISPNRGRDIAPFIGVLKEHLQDYDLVCKIHTKKSTHSRELEPWRKYLIDNLLGSTAVIRAILHNFDKSPELGIVYPLTFPYITFVNQGKGWGSGPNGLVNKEIAKKYFPELGIEDMGNEFRFTAGSMFWFRPAALSLLLERNLAEDDFPDEVGQTDGTLAHSIERLFLWMASRSGYQVKTTFFSSKNLSQ